MATVTGGIADTADILSARLVVDMSDKIHLLEDNKVSLTKLLSRLPKKPAGATTVRWMTDELAPKATTLNEALDTSETGVDVASGTGAYFQAGDIAKVAETGETMLVTSVSSDTLTVTRSWGTVAGTAAATGGPLLNLGPAFAEGAHLRVSDSDGTVLAKRVTETEKTNYTQIFRHATGITRTQQQVKTYGGNDRAYQRRKKMIEHVRDINLALHHGEKAASGVRRSLGGIIEFMPSGNTFSTATLTEAQFNADLKTAFRYGSDSKVLICSRKVAGIISEWASVVQRVEPKESQFGVRITNYRSPHGDVAIVTDHALEGTYYDKYAELVDVGECALRPLQDTALLVDRQLPDVDGKVDEYLTETSVEWGNENFHALWNSVTS
jgi:hypothetical protein